jgi:hypothetical protein
MRPQGLFGLKRYRTQKEISFQKIVVSLSDIGSIAPPSIRDVVFSQPSSNGMYIEVCRKLYQGRLLFTHDGLVSALEEMTMVLVCDVEVTGRTKLEVLHEPGERIVPSLNQKMHM